jgi:uncharacterized protein (TIGR04255 family)
MAAAPRLLREAPVTEALIDFRVAPLTELPSDLRSILEGRLRDRFPTIEERVMSATTIEVVKGSHQASSAQRLHGYWLKSPDGLTVAQFRFDGFTLNRLRPYTSWQEVMPQALELWNVYVEILRPTSIVRVAVRYINHLVLPQPAPELSRYLTAPPTTPPDASYPLTGFLVRLAMREPTTNLDALITQASDQNLKPGCYTVILDIDVYRVGDLDPHDAKLKSTLEALRGMKNRLFFGSITEETARLYE